MAQLHKKLGVISIGFFANTTWNFIFDYIVYPASLLYFGTFYGGILMTCVSLFLNFLLVLLYSVHEIDWFGFEEIRLAKDKKEGNRLIKSILKLGHWPAYFFLSLYDPFLAFVYAKGKRKSHKHFTAHDWFIFILAHIIGNSGWILLLTGVISFIKLFIY